MKSNFITFIAFLYLLSNISTTYASTGSTQITTGIGSHNIKANNVIINNNGFTLEQYSNNIAISEKRIINQIKQQNNIAETKLLNQELKIIQKKFINLQDNYNKEKYLRINSDKTLLSYKNKLPSIQFEQARKNLLNGGSTKLAEQAFDDIVKKSIRNVSKAAFQSAKLAEGRVDYKKAMKQYTTAASLNNNNSEYLLEAGRMAKILANYDKAKSWLEASLSIRQKKDANDINTAQAMFELADLYYLQGKPLKAKNLYMHAKFIAEIALHESIVLEASISTNLAEIYRQESNFKYAEPLYKHAISILDADTNENLSTLSSIYNNLALLYKTQRQYQKAEKLYDKSLAMQEKHLNKNDPMIASTLSNLALLYYSQGRYEKIEPLLIRAISINKSMLGENHPILAINLNNLADFYRRRGQYIKAKPLYLQAITIYEKNFPNGHPNIKIFKNNYNYLELQMN